MKKVKRWRYYCDFCKKAGNSGGHMRKHEEACTGNPQRVCGMCRESGLDQKPIDDLVTALLCHGDNYDEGLKVLREVADNCPSCILAAIRFSKVQRPPVLISEDGFGYEKYDDGVHINFDFMEEKKAFWASVNDAKKWEDDHFFY